MDDILQSDHAFEPGDLVRVIFDPPYRNADHAPIHEATGTVLRVTGLLYLQATSHRTAWRCPSSSI